jgi:hypothetical protein
MSKKKTETKQTEPVAWTFSQYWAIFKILFPGVISFAVGYVITYYWAAVRDYVIWTAGGIVGVLMGAWYILWSLGVGYEEVFR